MDNKISPQVKSRSTTYKRAICLAQSRILSDMERPPFSPTIDLIQELRQVLIDDPESESKSSSDHVRPAPVMLPIISGTVEGANGTGMIEEKAAISQDVPICKDISTLYPGKWLNDEIINDYGELIAERSEKANLNMLNVHFFNTFFWSTLTTLGYEGGRLDKWTTKAAVDIFAKDVVLIPINHENKHWTAAAINFRRKRIEAYDSLGSPKDYVYQHLRTYMDKEHQDKKKTLFDFTDWTNYSMMNAPKQENGFDCGVFACQTLEALSRGEEEFTFSQSNMPQLRKRMIREICDGQLTKQNFHHKTP